MKPSVHHFVLSIGVFIAQLVALTSPAFSAQDMGAGGVRQLTVSRSPTIHIEGKLSMSSGTLTLVENKTGKSFRLTQAMGAMQALEAGKKVVSIDGTLADNDTVEIQKIEAL